MSPATSSLLMFAGLACLVAAVAGSYRAFRYGVGRQKALGAIGPVLLFVGMLVIPFVGGVLEGIAATTGEPASMSWMPWTIMLFVAVAAIVGLVLFPRFSKPRP